MLSVRLYTRFTVLILGLLALTACIHPYTPPVQQGNVLTLAEVSELKVGMSKDEVQYLIGAPILMSNDLNPDEWDYVYTFKPSYSKPMKTQKLTLIFKNDKLAEIDGKIEALGKAQKPVG